MKKLLTFSNSTTLIVALLLIVGLLTSTAEAEITGAPGIDVVTYYDNPHEVGEVINSFDFGRNGTLYYTTGIKDPEAGCLTGFTVYKWVGEPDEPELIHYDPNAFGFSGGRIKRYGKRFGERILFNDGGTEDRMEFNYNCYDPKEGEPSTIIDSTEPPYYWGLSTRDGTDLWAAGAPDLEFGQNQSHIYYGSLYSDDADDGCGNNIHGRMVDLGVIGGGSGPLAFDSAGNLYYAQGYNWPFFSNAYIYRFSAAEVADAMDESNPLIPEDHEWETIISVDWDEGHLGASSMFYHGQVGLVLTATRAHLHSELRQYAINPDGTSGGHRVLATSTGRMSETRYHKGKIYFNDPDGIYCIDMTPHGMTMMK